VVGRKKKREQDHGEGDESQNDQQDWKGKEKGRERNEGFNVAQVEPFGSSREGGAVFNYTSKESSPQVEVRGARASTVKGVKTSDAGA